MNPEQTDIVLLRDCEAVRIPGGEKYILPKGTSVHIHQALGGSYTIWRPEGLSRITDANADALGLAPTSGAESDADKPDPATRVSDKDVWGKLKTCYDPEIPVNIVDLGLVYDCTVDQPEGAPAKVNVKMTLTAPGCGMGPTIAAEARDKIMSLPGVGEADVELVWDPAWNQGMISEVGKMKLGMI